MIMNTVMFCRRGIAADFEQSTGFVLSDYFFCGFQTRSAIPLRRRLLAEEKCVATVEEPPFMSKGV